MQNPKPIPTINSDKNRRISREELAKIVDAGRTLCNYCEADECEYCIVNRLINDAYNECPEANDDYEDGFDDEEDIDSTSQENANT